MGPQESDFVSPSDRRVVPGSGIPPDSAAKVLLSSVIATDITEAFLEVLEVSAWIDRKSVV